MTTINQVENDEKTTDVHVLEESLFYRLEISRKHAQEGNYRIADNIVAEMREKYGLKNAKEI